MAVNRQHEELQLQVQEDYITCSLLRTISGYVYHTTKMASKAQNLGPFAALKGQQD